MTAPWQACNLSNYPGYDFVIALTQGELNAGIKEAIGNTPQNDLTSVYLVYDENNDMQSIDYPELMQNAGLPADFNVFQIPANADPSTDSSLLSLQKANFAMAFQFQPGFLTIPAQVGDALTLAYGPTAPDTFAMYCNLFNVVQLTSESGSTTWMSESQPSGDQSQAWIITTGATRTPQIVDSSDYSTMPQVVQAAANSNTPGTFSVQQLILDMSSDSSIYSVAGVDPTSQTQLYDALMALQPWFPPAYFQQAASNASLLCSYQIFTNPGNTSTALTISALEFAVSPYNEGANGPPFQPTSAEQSAATLNYICSQTGSPSSAQRFPWNWVDVSDISNLGGAVAISRNVFVNYLRTQLDAFVMDNSYYAQAIPQIDSSGNRSYYVHIDNFPDPPAPASPLVVNSAFWLFYVGSGGTSPLSMFAPVGTLVCNPDLDSNFPSNVLLLYQYFSPPQYVQAEPESSQLGFTSMALFLSYSLTVAFSNGQLIVAQNQTLLLQGTQISGTATSYINGDLINQTLTDTYSVAVNDQGDVFFQLQESTRTNNNPSGLQDYTNWNGDSTGLDTLSDSVQPTSLSDTPLAGTESLVFPGGNTFAFSNAGISDGGDLVANITYLGSSSS